MNERITFLLNKKKAEKLKKKAESKGLNVSAYIRLIICKDLEEKDVSDRTY